MRKLVLAAAAAFALASARPVHADVGLGLFLGEPVGLDLKLGLSYRSALDIVLGWTSIGDGRDHYAHVTYLATPFFARGDSIIVPFRIGIGGALYDDHGFGDGLNFAVRAPAEIAIRFRNAPVEIYGEIALLITLIDANNNNDTFDIQGGIGARFYF